jgi:hypothetical protein
MEECRMTDWTHRTIIVEAAIAPNARAMCAMVPGGTGMFTTALSATGQAPATHYVSSGNIWPQFAEMLATADGMVAGAQAMGMPIDIPTAAYLLAHSQISDGTREVDGETVEEGPHAFIARMGLQMMQGVL